MGCNAQPSALFGNNPKWRHARATHFARKNGIYFDWQPRFHDHIVRDQDELNRIAEYIENNPARWLTDQLNDEVFKDMPEMMK